MFDRIVLGCIRRVVSHPDFYVDLVDKFLQVLLEQVLARTVAATPVAQQEEGGGVGPGRVELAGQFVVVFHTDLRRYLLNATPAVLESL